MSGDGSLALVAKVDDSLGLVFGWAIVCRDGGRPYVDLQGDHVPEPAMLAATTDFMLNSRAAKEMHAGAACGEIVHSFPLTTEIAAAMGIDARGRSGWMIAMKPNSAELLSKFRDGTYRGFSIGGEHLEEAA